MLLPTTELIKHWHDRQNFVLLDCEFGNAAHFFSIWQAWRNDPHRPQRLHYLVLVPHLINRSTLQSHLKTQAPILAEQLCSIWPSAVTGFHRIFLEQERLVLTLMCGDSKACLQQLSAQVDAFWLHGQNWKTWPMRWRKLAAKQALLASTDLEEPLQAQLQYNGFIFENPRRQPAYAHFSLSPAAKGCVAAVPLQRHAIVIGAGLAGSAACQRLTQRGWQVELIESQPAPAQQASGNASGIFMPLLSQDDNPSARLSRSAYLFAQHIWHNLGGLGQAFHGQRCGALQLARNSAHALIAQRLLEEQAYPADYVTYCTPRSASRLAGWPVSGGWYFPNAGWVQPASLCQAFLQHCGERLSSHFQRHASRLVRTTDGWNVYDQQGVRIANAPVVILANAHAARQFEQAQDLPLAAIRGQMTYLDANLAPAIHTVICGTAYLTPATAGLYSVGASYDAHTERTLRQDSQDDNLARLAQLLPGWYQHQPRLDGRVSFRCVAPDRLPLVGALAHSERGAKRPEKLQDIPRIPGLYCLLGYASRGLIWAPLAAELLAAQLNQEPLPLPTKLVATLDPARFLLKQQRSRLR